MCGYDTASRTRLWIHTSVHHLGAVCMLGAHVLVTVVSNPTFVLDCKTGALISSLPKADGWICGVGMIESSCFILS
jgi:hypothetical protein